MKVSFLQRLINVGVNASQSISEQRRIRNTNFLSAIASVIAFFVMTFYFFMEMYLLGSMIFVMSLLFAINIVSTYYGHNKFARNLSLILTNAILFFEASVLGRDSGVIFIYFPLICLGIFYFGTNEKKLTAFFLLFSFFTIQLLELTDYSLFQKIYQIDNISKSLFVLHLNIGLFLSCFFVFYVFITYQESEDVLSKSQHTLQTIFNNSSDALLIINYHTLLIEDCNNKAIEMFESENKGGLHHSRVTYLLKDGYKNDKMLEISKELQILKEWQSEQEFVSKKGKFFWGNLSMKYLNIEKDELLYLRISDITERKRNEERLKSTHNELETFMYKSSHNLKGPSASILGLIHVAKNEITDPLSIKYLSLIEESSLRLDSTLVDLLNITRIKQGGIIISEVDVIKIFREVLEDMQFYPGYSKVKIKTFLENIEPINSDHNLIKSILHNLFENSIKYRDPSKDSFVNISITEIESQIRIEITDNGIGIPSEYKDKVFNMFFRAHNISQGTGLGLYIVRTSVEKLQGNIIMETIEGKGTTFIISFPKYHTLEEE